MKNICVLILAAISLRHHALALQVTPGSTCAAVCLDDSGSKPNDPNASNTAPSDVVCTDDEYNTSTTGIKYQNCLDCLRKSNATSQNETDASWFIYNVRYTVDVCMYGFPNASSSKVISSPCAINTACGPLKKALESGGLNATADNYDYCTADNNAFGGDLTDCTQCLSSSQNQEYLANFIIALKAGCEQKPAPGQLLGLSGSIFTSSQVNITDPPSQETFDSKNSGGGSTFQTGDIVGIAIGAALLFLGGLGLFAVYHRKQKRLFKDTQNTELDPRSGSKSISPPLRGGFSAQPQMAALGDYELRAQQGYTKNADYYNMLEKEIQIRQPQYAFNPHHPGSALPAHPAYLPRAHSRQTSHDSVPQEPRPVKSNKPDSYALQAYLHAAEDADALGIQTPPRGTSPHLGASPGHSRASSVTDRGPSPDRRPLIHTGTHPQVPTGADHTPLRVPPPPPPRAPKVPSIKLPSIPRIKIPKKYVPPQINIEEATPVEGPSTTYRQVHAEEPLGVDISKPIVNHEPRFVDDAIGHRKKKEAPAPLIVQQEAVDRRPRPWVMMETQIRTGNSNIYG
ncbi:hypothetical protein F5Y15DRAFT_36511 [Xylariaceae sp. FL0016]|nr:hypothetical protein F5Y15DRAFT_36511 [Xylariaceae sp. FL0016]